MSTEVAVVSDEEQKSQTNTQQSISYDKMEEPRYMKEH